MEQWFIRGLGSWGQGQCSTQYWHGAQHMAELLTLDLEFITQSVIVTVLFDSQYNGKYGTSPALLWSFINTAAAAAMWNMYQM